MVGSLLFDTGADLTRVFGAGNFITGRDGPLYVLTATYPDQNVH